MRGSRCGCRIMPPRGLRTRISSSPKRLRKWSPGSPASTGVRSKARPKRTSASLTSNTTRDGCGRRGGRPNGDNGTRNMADAWIEGRPAAMDAAVAEAAKLLAASRLPVVAGLGTDVAGARAAVALAQRIGGVIDHMHAGAVLRALEVVRTAGMLVTTANEAALRADTLLLVGPDLATAWPGIGRELLDREPDRRWVAGRRRVFWLCPGASAPSLSAEARPIERLGKDPAHLKVSLGALRARLKGRPCGPTVLSEQELEDLAAALAAARFGVAVWAATALDALAIEMLSGIISD